MNKNNIKVILKNPAWKDVEEMFYESLTEEKKEYKTEGKSNEQIATDIKAREQVIKVIDRFINKLYRIANEKEKEDKIYI